MLCFSANFGNRYPLHIAIYFIITLVATFALVAAYLFTENEFVSPQYAPTIGLVLICVMSKDWSVWKKINWNVLNNLLWVFIALFLPAAVIMISSLIMSFMGTQFVAWHDTTIGYSITISISILGCVFEEIVCLFFTNKCYVIIAGLYINLNKPNFI